jgi:hypothetical protein
VRKEWTKRKGAYYSWEKGGLIITTRTGKRGGLIITTRTGKRGLVEKKIDDEKRCLL